MAMLLFMGIGMILIGGVSMLSALCNRKKGEQARSWRSVEATIVRSEVVVSGTGEERSVSPHIEYTYEVAGKKLSGNTIGFTTAYTESDVNAWVKKYPVRTTARLHYNPDNANESCLETGADPRTWLFLIGSVVMIGFGIYIILIGSAKGK